jgi:hypothetical protein
MRCAFMMAFFAKFKLRKTIKSRAQSFVYLGRLLMDLFTFDFGHRPQLPAFFCSGASPKHINFFIGRAGLLRITNKK